MLLVHGLQAAPGGAPGARGHEGMDELLLAGLPLPQLRDGLAVVGGLRPRGGRLHGVLRVAHLAVNPLLVGRSVLRPAHRRHLLRHLILEVEEVVHVLRVIRRVLGRVASALGRVAGALGEQRRGLGPSGILLHVLLVVTALLHVLLVAAASTLLQVLLVVGVAASLLRGIGCGTGSCAGAGAGDGTEGQDHAGKHHGGGPL
mmetsp:Transcript_96164/g.248657  ORF Transcript_96164/g.248657 Transcript_96164/m.248657 type:complete len:202 (-) Transcript_96164:53-658(-)